MYFSAPRHSPSPGLLQSDFCTRPTKAASEYTRSPSSPNTSPLFAVPSHDVDVRVVNVSDASIAQPPRLPLIAEAEAARAHTEGWEYLHDMFLR